MLTVLSSAFCKQKSLRLKKIHEHEVCLIKVLQLLISYSVTSEYIVLHSFETRASVFEVYFSGKRILIAL